MYGGTDRRVKRARQFLTNLEGREADVRMSRGSYTVRRRVERVLTASLVAGPVLLIILWLTFQHKPGWYRPTTLDDSDVQRARREAVTTADFVGDRMVEGRPFDVVLLEHSVNEWLAALPRVWPDTRDALPPEITSPAVAFHAGNLRIGAHYVAGAWQAIVSLRLTLRVSKDGTKLKVVLKSACGGSLRLPKTILRGLLERLLEQARSGRWKADGAGEPLIAALRRIQSVDDLFDGVAIGNRFIWFNGDRPFRIESIRIDDGRLRLRLEPL